MNGNLQTLPSPTDIEMHDSKNSIGLRGEVLSGLQDLCNLNHYYIFGLLPSSSSPSPTPSPPSSPSEVSLIPLLPLRLLVLFVSSSRLLQHAVQTEQRHLTKFSRHHYSHCCYNHQYSCCNHHYSCYNRHYRLQ